MAVSGAGRKLRLPGLRPHALAKASPEHDLGTMHPLDSLPSLPAPPASNQQQNEACAPMRRTMPRTVGRGSVSVWMHAAGRRDAREMSYPRALDVRHPLMEPTLTRPHLSPSRRNRRLGRPSVRRPSFQKSIKSIRLSPRGGVSFLLKGAFRVAA